jgi:hypothetical protein
MQINEMIEVMGKKIEYMKDYSHLHHRHHASDVLSQNDLGSLLLWRTAYIFQQALSEKEIIIGCYRIHPNPYINLLIKKCILSETE